MNHISFPGLGGLEFTLSRAAFGTPVYWYGAIIALGFLLAAVYALKSCRKFGIGQDDMCDVLIVSLPLSIIGARLFYVLGAWGDFKDNPAAIINIRDGGLAIYGGVIMAVVGVFIVCRFKKINVTDVLDIAGLGLLIGQMIGRWGNLFNAEVYGDVTGLPWGMSINGGAPVHPLFLYESLWNLVGFLLIRKRTGRRLFRGEMFLMYLGWYGLGRALLENLRDNAFVLYIGRLPLSQITAVAAFAFAIIMLAFGYNDALKRGEAEGINDVLPEPSKKKGGQSEEPSEDTSEEDAPEAEPLEADQDSGAPDNDEPGGSDETEE